MYVDLCSPVPSVIIKYIKIMMHWWWIRRRFFFIHRNVPRFLYLDFKICEGCRFFPNSFTWIFCYMYKRVCRWVFFFCCFLLPSQCALRTVSRYTFFLYVKFYPFALLLNLLNPFIIHIRKNFFEDFFFVVVPAIWDSDAIYTGIQGDWKGLQNFQRK